MARKRYLLIFSSCLKKSRKVRDYDECSSESDGEGFKRAKLDDISRQLDTVKETMANLEESVPKILEVNKDMAIPTGKKLHLCLQFYVVHI